MRAVPALLSKLFPTRVRFTGIAISCDLSAAIFGVTTPMLGAELYKITGKKISLAYYSMSLLCFI